jgi:restriction endonuclease Mrr
MTIKLPTSNELNASLLRVLRQNPDGLSTRDIDQAVIVDLGISSELASIIRSGNRTEIQYRLAWCRTKAKKANLIVRIENSKWRIK